MPASKNHKIRLVLLDSHAIIHRAYHALPDFATSSGEPTGALYGLVTMLLKLAADLKPDYIAACFDLPGGTHRHEAFEEYKAKRKKADDALITQLESAKEIFKAFGIPMYSVKGFEADDVLGTIVEKISGDKKLAADIEIIIASGDMDTLQLVSGNRVRVYTLRKGISDTVLYDEATVQARYEFGPNMIPDFKGLSGDPSDNITGVPGIGEKTATTLIQNFGTIENIYAALKKDKTGALFLEKGIKERVVTLLREHEDEARFSKMLATIRRDAPVSFVLPEKKWHENIDLDATEALFKKLEFRTLLDRVKSLIAQVHGGNKSGGDDEGVGGAIDTKNAAPENVKKTKNIFGDTTSTSADGPVDPDELEETALALWVVDSNFSNPDLSDILQYANTDSFKEARKKIFLKLEEGRTKDVYENIELPLRPVIKKMEQRGVKIDATYLNSLSKEYHTKLDALEKKITDAAGETFNINSPKQLGDILFDKMKLGDASGKSKKTAGGQRTTRESELEKMRDKHPIVGHVLEYRELQKLLSTYIDSIPEKLDASSRLHAHFVQTGAATGRFSSENPNLQNIPIKTELGKRIRTAFIAEKDFSFVTLDYSQIELRIAAFLSGDHKLIDIFKSGGDIHAGVASRIFNVPEDKVDYEMRRRAKIINFGILYGMGVNALRAGLGSTREEAKHFYDEYFKSFSELAAYLETIKKDAARLGYTETFFGRRRYFPGITSRLPFVRAANERMAINAPFQGTSADLIKLAMIRVNEYIESKKLDADAHLLMTVHDELVYEVRTSAVSEVVPKIRDIMEQIIVPTNMKDVPLVVKASVGTNWGNTKEI